MKVWSEDNRLEGTGSPYLEQHVLNPVHWIPWGEEVFNEARRRDLPVLVSIGYSTCHWCHVMAHQSFEVPSVAVVMNKALVTVKVDREQHPGVDAAYMEAAQTMTGSAGWPLNVFVDHEGRPFLAVTYLPPERWVALVREVHRIWLEDRERINTIAGEVAGHLTERRFSGEVQPETWPDLFLNQVSANYDADHPGFASGDRGMKFPPSQSLDWLLEYGGIDGRTKAMEILTAMMDSGLHDRVGGGFHRYSVDRMWRVPHFEKMTYDNAQMMGLYARASVLVGEESLSGRFLATARETANWFLREMRVDSPEGVFVGYATATDADDPLGEGSFFAWPPSELIAVLGEEDGTWLARRWHITGDGRLPDIGTTFEPVSSWIAHPRGSGEYREFYGSTDPEPFEREAQLILRLRSARSVRPAPGRDDKVLTDQNALLLEGFSRLARYDGGTIYYDAAVELADLLVANLDRNPPIVWRSSGLEAYISDYGYLAMALAAVYSLTGDPRYIETAEKVSDEALSRLATGDGDFFSIPEGSSLLYKRPVEEFEGPAPAGQYALGIGFQRLYNATGNPDRRERALGLIEARGALAAAAPTAVSSLVRLGSAATRPYTLVIAGPESDPMTSELATTTRTATGPDFMVVIADRAGTDVGWVELDGRIGLDRPQLLVCREGSCLLPAFTSEEAVQRLKQAGLMDGSGHENSGARPGV